MLNTDKKDEFLLVCVGSALYNAGNSFDVVMPKLNETLDPEKLVSGITDLSVLGMDLSETGAGNVRSVLESLHRW